MKLYNKVAIIGVGLIGGSIGVALRKKGLTRDIVGIGRRKSSLKSAKRVGAINSWTLDIKEGVKEADLVIIATPVGGILKKAKEIFKSVKRGAVVTDVGSVKSGITEPIDKITPKGVFFVGAHPVAGSEKKGPKYASAELFKGCTVILTRTRKTNTKKLSEIKHIWKRLGAGRIQVMKPKDHDAVMAQASHMPHIAAVATCLNTDKKVLGFTATGFKDTTRIAASVPEVWIDIFLMNRANMLKTLDGYKKNIELIRKCIYKKDRKGLAKILAKAKDIRDSVGK